MKPNEKNAQKRSRVVIDARMVGPIGHGIAEYVRDLVLGLCEKPEKEYELRLLVGENLSEKDPLRLVPHTLVRAKFLSPKEMIEVPKVLKELGADLFHSPSFAAFPFNSTPTIYTVHDLIHLRFGSFLHKAYYGLILKPTLRRAAKVCTVSDFSQREVAEWLGWPQKRIAVIKNAIHVEEPPQDLEERLKKWGLTQKKYHFSLSSCKPHKNMPFLIQAYLAHTEKNPDAWPLVLSLSPKEVAQAHPKVICVGGLDTDDKNALLAGAGAFYFPSLVEGFGRPPLEAIQAGSPVVVSKIPAHCEIFQSFSNGVLLSPDNLADWTETFDSAERGKLKNIEGTWSWDRLKLSLVYDGIYREALKKK